MPQWIIDFWNNNSGNIVVSAVTGVLFFLLGPIGVWFSGRKIRQERLRKAKEALLDVIEGIFVSQEALDGEKISVLFRAVAREVEVDLEASYDVENLLEDLMLRFEKSKHLDATQKDKYSQSIQILFKQIKENIEKPKDSDRKIPRPYAKIIDDLKLALDENNVATATKITQELEDKLVDKSINEPLLFSSFFQEYKRLFRDRPLVFLTASGIVIIVYVLILDLFFGVFQNP